MIAFHTMGSVTWRISECFAWFSRFAVDGVVNELVELLFHLGFGSCTKLCVLLDVRLEPTCLLILYYAVDLCELQAMLQIELEVEVVTHSSPC